MMFIINVDGTTETKMIFVQCRERYRIFFATLHSTDKYQYYFFCCVVNCYIRRVRYDNRKGAYRKT